MKKEQKALLELIRIAATRECLFTDTLLSVNWSCLLALAAKQGASSLCMSALEIMHDNSVGHCPIREKLQLYARREQIIKHNTKKHELSVAFSEMVVPVRLVVLKGLDYARFWPNPKWREFGDLDCFALEGETKLIEERAKEHGFEIEDHGYKHSIVRFNGLTVEMHHCFTDFARDSESILIEKLLRELCRNEFEKIEGSELYHPNANFTAVYLISHAHTHFFYEGMSLRMVLDWLFFLQKEGDNVDWKLVEDVLERTKFKKFAVMLTQICKTYFGLQFDCLSTDSTWNGELGDKFLEDIFNDKYNDADRRLIMMARRMLNRYHRMYRFKTLLAMPYYKAVWKTVEFNSFTRKKPDME